MELRQNVFDDFSGTDDTDCTEKNKMNPCHPYLNYN